MLLFIIYIYLIMLLYLLVIYMYYSLVPRYIRFLFVRVRTKESLFLW